MMTKQELVQKWSAVEGKMNIAGITDQDVKENLAVLLENQATVNMNATLLNETATTVTPSSEAEGQFKPIAMALVRRTFPELFANKVVGVQAMSGPVGVAYALRFTYNDGSWDNDALEAGFNSTNYYTGYTGSTPRVSGADNVGAGAVQATAEAWAIGTTMPIMSLKLSRVAITALTRKVAANFSLEAAMDIKATQNIDIEREMVNILQYEILAEIDRELLASLKTVAVDTTKGGEAAVSFDVSASDGRWSQERLSNLVNVIIKKANDIAISTRRGAGNYVVVSPRVASALQSANSKQWFSSNNASAMASTSTVTEVGNINNVLTVYRDSYAQSDYALVGYKGPTISDSGIIYSPYITGLVSRAVTQEDFSPRIGVMSRYAITNSLLGAGRYTRLISISNLDKVLGN